MCFATLLACRFVQQATAISLAQLAPTGPELKSMFVDKPGLDVLLDLVTDETATASEYCHGRSCVSRAFVSLAGWA